MTPVAELSLIFPAYNERARIRETLQQAITFFETEKISFEMIVSADGTDGTRELVGEMVATDHRIRMIGNRERRGKGHGIRAAVHLARGTYIGFADADGKTPIQELKKFMPHLRAGRSVVIGNRWSREAQVQGSRSFHRRIGSKVFSRTVRIALGVGGIEDTQCGFKFFGSAAAKTLFSLQKIDGYMFDVEILVLARRLGYEIIQVPVQWQDDHDTRLNLVRGNLQNLWDLAKIRFLPRPQSALTSLQTE